MSGRTVKWLVLVLASGCLEALAPEVGPQTLPPSSTCPGDSDPQTAVSYQTDIEAVFERNNCVECHTGEGRGTRQSGLDLGSYAALRTGGGRSGVAIVIDGDPCGSILVQKLELSPPFGRRMPYDGPPFLSAAHITLVRDWIAEGARDN